ncbi:MAG TPA: glycosyltransferase family 4 protein [Bellilinea sp.]|nr:glycosyltransferase family 4 protein [Bellilinea sp.]
MRVGLVIYGSLDTLSGGYLYDRKLVEALRAQGDTVEIISLPVKAYAGAVLQNFSMPIRRRLVNLKVDALLQDELNHPSLFWLNGWLRPKVKFPLIGIVHHLRSSEQHASWLLPLYRIIERQFLNSLDGYIFNSQSSQKAVEQLTSDPRPYVIATPGGDALESQVRGTKLNAHSLLIRRNETQSRLEILFVGNLIERKGLHTLLEALRVVSKSDWHLRVVGRLDLDPGYTRRCQNLASQGGLAGKVEFLGAITDAELIHTYQTSQLLVVTSSFEGFGIVYLEAMRWGVVTVGSTAGGAAEIIQHGKNGWLIEPGDSTALAGILQTVCQNPEILLSLSQAARMTYERFPTWSETTEKIRQFLLVQI